MRFKNRTLLLFACIMLLLEVAGVSVFPMTKWDNSFSGNLDFSPPINWVSPFTKDREIVQNFSTSEANLRVIDIFLATYGRKNTATLILELLQGETPIARTAIATKILKNNSFYQWRIPTQKDSAGKTYTLRMTSPDGIEENSVTTRYGHAPKLSDTDLRIDGQTIDGTLFVVPRYATTSLQYLHILATRINLNKGGLVPVGLLVVVLAGIVWMVNLGLLLCAKAILDLFERLPRLQEFLRYVIVGGSAATIELLLFLILFYIGLFYLTANIIAFTVATTYGFFLQKLWTFRNSERRYAHQAAKFLIVIAIGFLLNNFFIYLLLDVAGWHPFIAKFTQLWLVLAWNYSGQRFWAFTQSKVAGLGQ